MDINYLRKIIFANSPDFNFYNFNGCTVVRGFFKEKGYAYRPQFSDENLSLLNKKYRMLNAILNTAMAAEILLYVYLFIFPYFLNFMELPFYLSIILLSIIPLILLYLNYVVINYLYELFLTKTFGKFQKIMFEPNIRKIDENQYKKYIGSFRKSVLVIPVILLIFLAYAITPYIIIDKIDNDKYSSALKLSLNYLKFVPINPEIYALKAYSQYKLKDYKGAVENFEKANQYSFSESFDNDILMVKANYLDKISMIDEFDKAINLEENEFDKRYIMYEKAAYLLENKDYNGALKIYDNLINKFDKDNEISYPIDHVYYNRAVIRRIRGDIKGAAEDFKTAFKMCPDCDYSKLDALKVRKP